MRPARSGHCESRRATWLRGNYRPDETFLVLDRHRSEWDLPVELVLCALKLQVADEDPGERACEEEADGDDARGGG